MSKRKRKGRARSAHKQESAGQYPATPFVASEPTSARGCSVAVFADGRTMVVSRSPEGTGTPGYIAVAYGSKLKPTY